MNRLSNIQKYSYNRIILVLLNRNDVKVISGLVYLYMYIHFDIHSCGTSLSNCGHRLGSGTT